MESNRPGPNFFAGIAAFDRKSSLKKAVTQITRRDGTVVEEQMTADGSYHHTKKTGETKDMSYLEREEQKIANRINDDESPKFQGERSASDISKLPLDPNAAWHVIQEKQIFQDVPTIDVRDSRWCNKNSNNDCTRIVCISDTHGNHRDVSVPKGDILIHGGDFTNTGEIQQIQDTIKYFQELAFPTTICIAGNHELTLDHSQYERRWRRFHRKKMNFEKGRHALLELVDHSTSTTSTGLNNNKTTPSNCPTKFFYLEDSSCHVPIAGNTNEPITSSTSSNKKTEKSTEPQTSIHDSKNSNDDNSVKKRVKFTHNKDYLSIYGSPWSPEFFDWAFNVPRGEPSWETWSKIPDDTDILVTHGPPLGRGDLCDHGGRAGCLDLLEHVQKRIQPRLHIFGHIHEAFGTTYDGTTLYVNASNLDLAYDSAHPCTVIDLPHDPRLPPRVVQPYCTIKRDELVNGNWFRDNGFHILADVVAQSECAQGLSNIFPSGNELLQSVAAYESISQQLAFRTTKCLKAKRELRRALLKMYAESF